jgi:hypothetical protein
MAKFKPAGSRKPKTADSKRGLIPCLILVLLGFGLVTWLFWALVTSGQ